jgi:O-antigen/teichoic acid export membrane protein
MIKATGNLRSWLQQGSFRANVAVLAGGTAISQALTILASPILTRLYAPDDFGMLAVYISVVSIVVVICALRYELAIPLPEDDESAANLLVLSLVIVVVTSLLTGAVIWLMGDQLTLWLDNVAIKPYLWLLPISLLGAGVYQALEYWAMRKKRFGVISSTLAARSLGQVVIQILGGVLAVGAVGLIAGYVVSQFIGITSLFRRSQIPTQSIRFQKWIDLIRTYRNFPLFSTWASLVDIVGIQLPSVLFATFFSLSEAGYFALTMRVLGMPSILIGQAVGQTFYATVARHEQDSDYTRSVVERLASLLLMVSFMIFIVVILYGPFLFSLVFGEQWESAGRYAQYLAPWFMLSLVSSPLSTLTLVKGRQKEGLWFSGVVTTLRLGAIWLGAQYASSYLAVALFSAAGALIYLIYIAWILRLAGSSLLQWMKHMQVFLLAAMLMVVFLLVAQRAFQTQSVITLMVSVLCLGVFGLWAWHTQIRKTLNA